MPFIAIAVIVALAIGGGVTVAADQAKPGDALYEYKVTVNDNIKEEYRAIRATIDTTFGADVEAESDVDASADARITADADAEAQAQDDRINADGSLEADLESSLELNLR